MLFQLVVTVRKRKRTINQPTNQSINQSINHSINQSINQSFNQTTNKQTNKKGKEKEKKFFNSDCSQNKSIMSFREGRNCRKHFEEVQSSRV